MNKRLILVRHAERPDIPAGEVGNDVLLNAKGLQASFAFGQSLNQNIISIRTSPISRCVQTATEIAKAVGYDRSNIKTCTDLGSPGYFISDGSLAWRHWQEKGSQCVNQFLLDGSESWDGFNDLKKSAAQFKNKVEQALKTSQDGTHLWVTHDTILAAFSARVLDEPITINEWPEYLSFLSVDLTSEGQTRFQYKPNKRLSID